MLGRLAAFCVHLFTALGVIFGFQAFIEAAAHRWESAFAWLGAALLVDGLDGPLARQFRVGARLPRFSGERLDLIIDYLTYVVVPAYIVHGAKLVPAHLTSIATAIILLSSLFHFVDRQSKTEDGFFVGFPAIWNIVALYCFIFSPSQEAAFICLVVLGFLTFIPFKWIHPIRVRQLRPITFAVMAVWTLAVIAAIIHGFPSPLTVQLLIALSTIYVLAIGIFRSVQSEPDP